MTMNIPRFDRNKLHLVPPMLIDYAMELQDLGNTPEVRENYALRFEVAKEYAEYCLNIHEQLKKETGKRRK